MCSGGCAKCLGITLIPLALLCTLANILLFFPGGEVTSNNEHITDEVWYFGGILGSGVLMFTSIIFAAVGLLGAGYCFIVSAVALNRGPKCNTDNSWTYPFENGNYLSNTTIWTFCTSPENIVPWNLTLFSLLLIMSGIQIVLCAIQVVNGLIGTICGDCNCCGCCGVSKFVSSVCDYINQ
ncbi:Transmembrane 4 L6 family member 4 [Chelonia mydas]|uniref:Transmembrane 4 L6 family member 4 n=1 Tax=Chelonia mydas TaxID=8469 RepID=M7C0X0_CHEMY|nr:Transmembrane 4 L6 family member 4 [Chelonia mydas]